MPKIKVVCTSTGCLEYSDPRYEEIRKQIDIIRVHMFFQGQEYLEGIGFNPEDFYKIMEKVDDVKGNLPHTGIPQTGEIAAVFEKAIEEGYEKVLVIALSSYLGGTWNAIRLVAEDYQDKIQIVTVDAKITCFQEGLMAIMAQEMVNAGKDIPEILQEIEWRKAHQEFIGVAGRLDYMVLNGRLKGGAAFFGPLLHVCPIVHFDHNGVLGSMATAMGTTRAIMKMDEELVKIIGDRKPEDYILYRGYTGKSLQPQQMKLEGKYGIVTNHPDCIMSCVTGIHVGPWVISYNYTPIRRPDEELPPVPDYYYEQLGLKA